jgi:hypothetical protein
MQVVFPSQKFFRTPNVTPAITFIWIDTDLLKKELKLLQLLSCLFREGLPEEAVNIFT